MEIAPALPPDALPQPGLIVHVRSRQYLVEAVTRPEDGREDTLVRLACLEDDAQGEPLEVLWEREVDARLQGQGAWEDVSRRGFDDPRLFSAWLHTLRWSGVTAADIELFQAPWRAGIEVKAYQLEPLRRALAMPRVNLFIADDVGLGKTIEAGLVLRELLLRQKVRRCVVCCPPSVIHQWKQEMEERFGLGFVVYDRAYVAEMRRSRGYGVNPWTTHSRFILSHALLRDELYAAPLRDWLGEFAGASMLILDEAHHVAPSSGSRYAIDSHLTRAIRGIAPRFEHRLFLSATPHNGHSNSFSALLEILDPQRFIRGVPVDPDLRQQVMVRRLKQDLAAHEGGFPERRVEPVLLDNLPADTPELALGRLLQRYRHLREQRVAGASPSHQAAALLVLTSLQKRLLSSIEAFFRTLRAHRRGEDRRAAAAPPPSPRPLQWDLLLAPPSSDDERSTLTDAELEADDDAQMEAASASASPGASPEERALLDQMERIASDARYLPDVRIQWLLAWLRQHLCPNLGERGADWLPRRLLIFTEYTDTQRYLTDQLRSALGSDAAERLAVFSGHTRPEEREDIQRRFNADPQDEPLRILVATDAAREGVNLQNHCADLLHFDIPWNPGRMEQRNGRLDRKLQRAPVVHCRYFALPQRPEDRVLQVLIRKTQIIQGELGSLAPVLARAVDEALQRGIRDDQADTLAASLERLDDPRNLDDLAREHLLTARAELGDNDKERQEQRLRLTQDLKHLQQRMEASRRWLGLDERLLRDALSASLELLGAPPLQPTDSAQAALHPDTAAWSLPPLTTLAKADPTWDATLDTLRPPRPRDASLRQWRADTAPRPVIFRDPQHLDGDNVHLHLEHGLVKRLLGRFVAQGFVHDDLARACIVRVDDDLPRVLLIGRLSLYGEGGSRLHDELITTAALYSDEEALSPLDPLDVTHLLKNLDDALARRAHLTTPDATTRRLQALTPQHIRDLQPKLEAQAQQRTLLLEAQLKKRAEAEAASILALLRAQRQRIEAQRDGAHTPHPTPAQQLSLHFSEDERRQLEADRIAWQRRLEAIAKETRDEPKRIRALYKVQATRMEPVGIVYLWPLSA